jgi:hypothetical protein
MAECKYCGKKVHTIGTKPRIFCSDRCRKAQSRQEQTDRIANGHGQIDKRTSTLDKSKGMTNQGITEPKYVIPEPPLLHKPVAPKKYALHVIPKPERTAQGNIRVSKPGDADYEPQCETTRAFIEGRDKRPKSGKRGKDIKCFEDLPDDVRATIDQMSRGSNGKIDHTILVNRTAIAVNYQHIFPERFHSVSI